MLFNSLTFVVFFAVVLGLHNSVRSWRARKWVLLCASYLFYAAWNPPFVILLWVSTGIDWWVARAMASTDRVGKRKILLVVSLCANLGFLAFFKYGEFLLQNFVVLAASIGMEYSPATWNIVLPVGISFYTFQTLSYTIDVYRGRLEPSEHLLDFAVYVTFFPQLVAGPIVRAAEFLPQLVHSRRATRDQVSWGMLLITLGLFQKTVLADSLLAPTADAVFGFAFGPLDTLDAWIGLLAFSGQIFFDFAGYSTCAIGAALCLGFVLPDNFRAPYAAIGFSDFWRRWHITLSSWLRDYLYIPLGGSRHGHLRTLVSLVMTMFLGGLWHGASWTFVVWGLVHGLFLVVEHMLKGRFDDGVRLGTAARVALGLLTFALVSLLWVCFRAQTFAQAGLMYATLFYVIPDGTMILPTIDIVIVVVVIVSLLIAHWLLRDRDIRAFVDRAPAPVIVAAWTLMLFGIITAQGVGDAFIYFQF